MAGEITPLRTLTPKDVKPRQVVSYEVSTLFGTGPGGAIERYNPDELATRKGLLLYRKMMDDEQVKAVVKFRTSSIIARGFEFIYDEDSTLAPEEQDRRIKFFQANVRGMRGSFQDAMNAILRAHQYGFSLTEKVYDTKDFDGKPQLMLAQLLSRDPCQFRFFTDEFGTLVRTEQWVGNKRNVVDLEKFVHLVRAPEEDRYYGQSDLKAAYRAYYTKDVTIKLYAIYLERFAGGFAYATLPAESSLGEGQPEYTALVSALSNIRNLASLILPPGVELNLAQPGSTAEYREALTYFDLGIAKALLVPNLLGLSHTGQTGAFAQSQTQLEAYFMTTAADTARLEDVLNEQLFKDLGDVNWGDGEYPRFTFKPASAEHIKWIVDTYQKLTASNAILATGADEKHLRKLLDMPSRKEEDPLVAEEKAKRIDTPALEAQAKLAPKPTDAAPFTRAQLRREIRRAVRFGYNPNQPRDPAGSSTGGQWTGGAGADDRAKDLGQPRAYLDKSHRNTVDDYERHGYSDEFADDYKQLAEEIVKESQKTNMPADLVEEAQNFLDDTADFDTGTDDETRAQGPRRDQDWEEFAESAEGFMDEAVAYLNRKRNPTAFGYNPNQPRDPAGTDTGGQWTGDGKGPGGGRGKRGAKAAGVGDKIASNAQSAEVGQVFRTRDGGYAIKTDRKKTGYDQITIDKGMRISHKGVHGRVSEMYNDKGAALVDWDNRRQEVIPVEKFPRFKYEGYDTENDFAYNPNQPRDPAGTDTGGRWTSIGAGRTTGPDLRPIGARPSTSLHYEDNAPFVMGEDQAARNRSQAHHQEHLVDRFSHQHEVQSEMIADQGLTNQEIAHAYYAGDGYKAINAHERGDIPMGDETVDTEIMYANAGDKYADLDAEDLGTVADASESLSELSGGSGLSAINHMVDANGGDALVVYRGVYVHSDNDDEWFNTFQPGTEFQEPGFFSTTFNAGEAVQQANFRMHDDSNSEDPDGRVALFRLAIGKGTRGFLGNRGETEIVLDKRSKFRVVKAAKTGDDVEVIDLEVIR